MIDLISIRKAIKETSVNLMPFGILLLAGAIFFFAVALFGFTYELSRVRQDLPHALDRIDRQISEVGQIAGSAEATGKNFSSALDKGIGIGIVDAPLNTVANVGYKISDTTNSAAMQFTNFWEGLKNRLFYKPKEKPTPTSEATPVKKVKK